MSDAYYTMTPPICLLEVPPSARCQLLLERARNATRGNWTRHMAEAYAYNDDPHTQGAAYAYGTFEHPLDPRTENSTGTLNRTVVAPA